jgi:hypothetical protein
VVGGSDPVFRCEKGGGGRDFGGVETLRLAEVLLMVSSTRGGAVDGRREECGVNMSVSTLH